MHTVAVVVLEDFILFDLALAVDVFDRARSQAGEPLYKVYVAGQNQRVSSQMLSADTSCGLEVLAKADTIIVPGRAADTPTHPDVTSALQAAARRGARIASICAGAFVLAEAGLLDGLKATTHWRLTDALAARYPKVEVAPDVLFVDNGQVLTSAGLSSGIDLCLHMIRQDYGARAASLVAEDFVTPLPREGAQAQRITRNDLELQDEFAVILLWVRERLGQEISTTQIADQFHLSTRSLSRKFRKMTGTTPLQWILQARIRQAQLLLETSDLPVESIATATGFSSGGMLRTHFQRSVGVSPTMWRATYQKPTRAVR